MKKAILMMLASLLVAGMASAQKLSTSALPTRSAPGFSVDLKSNHAVGVYYLREAYTRSVITFTRGASIEGNLYVCQLRDADADDDLSVDTAAGCVVIASLGDDITDLEVGTGRRWFVIDIDTAETTTSLLTIRGTNDQASATGGGGMTINRELLHNRDSNITLTAAQVSGVRYMVQLTSGAETITLPAVPITPLTNSDVYEVCFVGTKEERFTVIPHADDFLVLNGSLGGNNDGDTSSNGIGVQTKGLVNNGGLGAILCLQSGGASGTISAWRETVGSTEHRFEYLSGNQVDWGRDIITNGSLRGLMEMRTLSSDLTLLREDMLGSRHDIITSIANTTVTLPAVSTPYGMHACFVASSSSNTGHIKAAPNDFIVLNNVALDDGDKISSTTGSNDAICFFNTGGFGWRTNISQGTWTDGGA